MRSYKGTSQFFKEMKKKPDLENIIKNIDKYSISEIEKLTQPLWIRKELIKLKSPKDLNGNAINQNVLDYAMSIPIEIKIDERKYPIRKWQGGTWNMPYSAIRKYSNSSFVEINDDDLVLIINSKIGYFLFDYRHVYLDDRNFQYLINGSVEIETGSQLEYKFKNNLQKSKKI